MQELDDLLQHANDPRCDCECARAEWNKTKWPYRLVAATIETSWFNDTRKMNILKFDMKIDGCDREWARAVHTSAFGTNNSSKYMRNIEKLADSNCEDATKFIT